MARIGYKPLAALCRRLSTALAAGVDVRTVMVREAERAPRNVRDRFLALSGEVASGGTVADAVNLTGEYFPSLFRELVALGDETGKLPEAFARLADHYEHQVRLRRQFIAGITWPMIQLGAAIVIVGFMIWILGVIAGGNLPFDMLGLGPKMYGNRGLAIYIAIISGIGILIVGAVRILMSEAAWTGPLQRLVYSTPFLGHTLQMVALSRLTWALGLSLESGMEIRRAIAAGFRSTHSAIFTEQIPRIVSRIEGGQTIHEALVPCRVLPQELLDAVDVGEQSGQLPETLLRQSDEYQDRARAALAMLAVVAGFLVWGLVAVIIGAIVINIVSNYAKFITDLSKP
ncbi:MAG: type II secretion system F family protein [Planctomycetia bacterium]|nr:type II secretion system F family protein [Planctomycetia bacterium]